MAIQDNQVVTIHFKVKDQNGDVVDSTKKNEPYSFIKGQNQILPKLEEKIGDMIIGSTKKLDLPADQAYGEYNEKAVQQVKRSDFPENTRVEEGMGFIANTSEGKQLPFTVKKVENEDVTIDFNHPLAGKDLSFEVELVNVREATQEELSHGHPHGPGGQAH